MSDSPAELRSDAELRNLILCELHKSSSLVGTDIVSSLFVPPISRPDIFRIGIQLRDLGLVADGFARTKQGWSMKITTRGILVAEQL